METIIKVYLFLALSGQISITVSQDPCTDAPYTIEGQEKRSPDYSIDFATDIAFSDDRLLPGWYRILNAAGDDMPTSAPGAYKCGTYYPIWLQGSLPTTVGITEQKTVCLQSDLGVCELEWNINVRKCTGSLRDFFVYELATSPVTDSGYCFGSSGPCPSGTSSETGYTPCSADYPKNSFSPTVGTDWGDGLVNTSVGVNVEPVFICAFTDTGDSYFYDIHWYINGNSIKTYQKKLYKNIDETYLRPRHWEASYDMNMEVRCSVRARISEDSVPGLHHYSPWFTAGVVPESYSYEVEEGNFVEVKFKLTVPLGCQTRAQINNKCNEIFKISYPEKQSCIGSRPNVVVENSCGAQVMASQWGATQILKVYGNVDGFYNADSVRYSALSLKKAFSLTDRSDAWQNVIIPDINIAIRDSDRKIGGRTCETYTDPNYNTFDGRYYATQTTGEYVLYRHKREPYWVHTLSSGCDRWEATCNVGVAIRSHDSLFVVRTVDHVLSPLDIDNTNDDFTATLSSRRFPVVDLQSCDDKNMKIERTGKDFTVTLPSGTKITFIIKHNFGTWGMLVVNNILITPSVIDIGQTEGLCGNFNFDYLDDFTDRDTFVSSWFISKNSSDSLFKTTPTFTNNNFYNKPFCVCGVNSTTGQAFSNIVHCNLTQPRVACYNTVSSSSELIHASCSGHRKKRSIDSSDDIIDIPELTYEPGFKEAYIPKEPSWRLGWTEETARQFCEDSFNNVTALDTCREYANLDPTKFVDGCVTDIKITGGTDLVPGTIETMFVGCLTEVSKNESLWISQYTNSSSSNTIESDFTGTILDFIKSQLCTNNCSQHGTCTSQGVCLCDNGYIGEDCSLSRSEPPKHISIPGEGKCQTNRRSCSGTLIYGSFDAIVVWCRLLYFQIRNNIKVTVGSYSIIRADYQSQDAVSCPLTSPSRRKKRSTDVQGEGYDISLSYDGINFGSESSIVIYDENCFSCNATSFSCTDLATCGGSTSTVKTDSFSSSSEHILVSETTTFSHSSDQMNDLTTKKGRKKINNSEEGLGMTPIIAGIVALVVIATVLIGVILYFKLKANNKRKDDDNILTMNYPPCDTTFKPEKLRRPNQRGISDDRRPSTASSVDMQLVDQRPSTPDYLFIASEYKN